jgi:hypothetical protein
MCREAKGCFDTYDEHSQRDEINLDILAIGRHSCEDILLGAVGVGHDNCT